MLVDGDGYCHHFNLTMLDSVRSAYILRICMHDVNRINSTFVLHAKLAICLIHLQRNSKVMITVEYLTVFEML